MRRLAAEVFPGRQDGARLNVAVVAMHRIVERVRQHAAAVETLPPEEVVGEAVGLRPIDLDGEEAVNAALSQQLRQRRREAETVGQPADLVPHAEGAFEIALSVEDLAGETLAGGHIGVWL